jgi:2-dehydropantoate 2-reductase
VSTNSGSGSARVAVVGAGAVGSYFGGMLARAGVAVTLIGRPAHVEAIRRDGLFLDCVTFQEKMKVEASTEISAARDAGFVLLCVKTLDTEETMRALKPNLASGAIVVSLQNGVDNVERIRAATGIDALPSVVYVAAAMLGPGHVKHNGRGDLVIGEFANYVPVSSQPARTERVAEMFVNAGVPCRISANIEADLWTKLIMNCAGNAVSALARSSYGRAARDADTRELMSKVIAEAIAVARGLGIQLPDVDMVGAGLKLAEVLGEATSSTAQDIARGKRTEIGSLNGYIVKRGAELGIPTPVNFTLYALVTLLEQNALKQARPAAAQ